MGGIQDVRPSSQGHAAVDPELAIEGLLIAGGFAVTSELMDDEASWRNGLGQKASELGAKAEGESEPKLSVDAAAPRIPRRAPSSRRRPDASLAGGLDPGGREILDIAPTRVING